MYLQSFIFNILVSIYLRTAEVVMNFHFTTDNLIDIFVKIGLSNAQLRQYFDPNDHIEDVCKSFAMVKVGVTQLIMRQNWSLFH